MASHGAPHVWRRERGAVILGLKFFFLFLNRSDQTIKPGKAVVLAKHYDISLWKFRC